MLRLTQRFFICYVLFLASFKAIANNNTVQRNLLGYEYLHSAQIANKPLSMKAFSAYGDHQQPSIQLQGTFTFSPAKFEELPLAQLKLTENSAVYQFEKRTRPAAFTEQRKSLPKMKVSFVQFNDKIIPENRQLQLTNHPHWDFIIGTGNIWQEANDNNFSRIAMPFALVEKNQNCVHNGVLSFLVDQQGKSSKFYYQISSETCLYYKVDMWGKGKVTYKENKEVFNNTDTLIKQYKTELISRIPQQPIAALIAKNATIELSNLALVDYIKPTDMTSFGVIYNGIHFASKCQTRFGDYPFCSQLVLPSYSTAKSIFGGISMLYLAKDYPAIFDEKVSDWVEECQGDKWQGVSFGHLLNMTTGNYHLTGHSADEAAEHSQEFFKAETHQGKVAYSCRQFPRKSSPGGTFVYHTSDTYLLGTALNAFLKHQLIASGKSAKVDLFNIIFKQKLWPQLNLSQVAYSSRKTIDNLKQPFVGFGLFFINDDIAKISQFLMSEQLGKSNILDKIKLNSTLHNNQSHKDTHSQYPFIHYQNGFWKRNVTTLLKCEKETWLPYMLGYGGINIVLAKDNLQYYYFSDSDHYLWLDAIKELNKLTPLCR